MQAERLRTGLKDCGRLGPDPGGRARWWTGETRHLEPKTEDPRLGVDQSQPGFRFPGRRGTS